MDQLQLKEKFGANYVMYELAGDLNSYTASEFKEKVFENIKNINVVVDLSQILSIDSTGIGIIMAGFNDGEEYSHKFFLMNPSPASRTALEETGFDNVFTYIHSVTEIG